MLSKCANPTCSTSFRYLHEGKLFKLQTKLSRENAGDAPAQNVEYFWLCDQCARTLEVVVRNGVVSTRPRQPQTEENAASDEIQRKPRRRRQGRR
jgi:hypothetical protein